MLPGFRRIAAMAALGAGLGVLSGCSDPAGAAATADAGPPSVESALLSSCKVSETACTKPAPHYADVAPILNRSCNPCHTGVGNAPWALTDYEHVSAWAESIQQDLSGCTMPPLDGGIGMTASERLEVINWVQCGDLP